MKQLTGMDATFLHMETPSSATASSPCREMLPEPAPLNEHLRGSLDELHKAAKALP